MRGIHAAVLAALLTLAGGALRAEDTVVLNDGSVIMGQVLQETPDQVVVLDEGVRRVLDRGVVSQIEFDTSPNVGSPYQGGPGQGDGVYEAGGVPPSGDIAGPAPDEDEQDYVAGVAGFYGVPEDEVWGFEEQGIPYQQLPVVFYVANRAGCAPGLVASLRLSGMSWGAICTNFGLGPGIFYWPNLFSANLGGPYGSIYVGFHGYPRDEWNWNSLNWNDDQIVDCVNLRFETGWWHLRPAEVARWRRLGHPFYWHGYGYRRPGAFHRPGFAARRGWAHARQFHAVQKWNIRRGPNAAWNRGNRGPKGPGHGGPGGGWDHAGQGGRNHGDQGGGWNRDGQGGGGHGDQGGQGAGPGNGGPGNPGNPGGGWNNGAQGGGQPGWGHN